MKLFVVSFFRIHRLRVLRPSSKSHKTRKWPRAWQKARDGRGTLARACTSLTKSEEKERLLTVKGNAREKNFKSIWSPPRSRPRPRIWRSLIMHRGRRLFSARTGDILAYLYLDKAYLWRRELELWQYNDPALDLSRCAFLWGFL